MTKEQLQQQQPAKQDAAIVPASQLLNDFTNVFEAMVLHVSDKKCKQVITIYSLAVKRKLIQVINNELVIANAKTRQKELTIPCKNLLNAKFVTFGRIKVYCHAIPEQQEVVHKHANHYYVEFFSIFTHLLVHKMVTSNAALLVQGEELHSKKHAHGDTAQAAALSKQQKKQIMEQHIEDRTIKLKEQSVLLNKVITQQTSDLDKAADLTRQAKTNTVKNAKKTADAT